MAHATSRPALPIDLARANQLGALLALATLAASTPAQAQTASQTFGNILGNILQGAIVQDAINSWQRVDQQVQSCLVSQYGVNPANLAQSGVRADDSRVTPYIQSCNQLIARQQAIQHAVATWQSIDPDVVSCLGRLYGVTPGAYAQAGVATDDPNVAPKIQACDDVIAQGKAQAEAARQAALEAERQRELAAQEADEKAKADAAAAAERAHKEEELRIAAAKQQAAAKHDKLVAQFGAKQAADIETGKIEVGMSKSAVIAAIGNPPRRESIPPDDELWTYGSQRVAISHGKVTYIEH